MFMLTVLLRETGAFLKLCGAFPGQMWRFCHSCRLGTLQTSGIDANQFTWRCTTTEQATPHHNEQTAWRPNTGILLLLLLNWLFIFISN